MLTHVDYLVDYNINKTLVLHHFQRIQGGQAGNQRDWLSPVSPTGLEDRSVPVDTAQEPSQQLDRQVENPFPFPDGS